MYHNQWRRAAVAFIQIVHTQSVNRCIGGGEGIFRVTHVGLTLNLSPIIYSWVGNTGLAKTFGPDSTGIAHAAGPAGRIGLVT